MPEDIFGFTIQNTLKDNDNYFIYLASKNNRKFLLTEFLDPEMANKTCAIAHKIYNKNIAKIESFESEGKSYLSFDITSFTVISDVIKNTPLVNKTIEISIEIIKTLGRIHQMGITYNALSLEDIYIDATNTVLLTNFQHLYKIGEKINNTGLNKNIDSSFISPELTGRVNLPLNIQSDFYSLGILMYKMVTDSFPFKADDISELYSLHIAKPPVNPVRLNLKLNENLSEIILKLLEKNPEQRYKSHQGIIHDLKEVFSQNFEIAQKDFDIHFKISPKIYGRESEIELMKQNINEAYLGKLSTVILAGFSGVGKSSLVQEIKLFDLDHSINFISGKFQQYKTNIPYFAFVEAFNCYFDKLLLSKKEEHEQFVRKFHEKIGEDGGILTAVFPRLEVIVGKQEKASNLVGTEAENRFIYTFLNFLKLIASKENPLVLFLDDLQWTDLVSLNILKAIIKNEIQYLFIGLAYRDNEVDFHHPFHNFMDEIKPLSKSIHHLKLNDLKLADIVSLLIDSRIENVEELAKLIHKKTLGNSFFVHQFIRNIHEKQLLRYLSEKHLWQADIKRISELDVSENVVFFMQQSLKMLGTEIINILKMIGAIGHNAEYPILEFILDRKKEVIRHILNKPIKDRLLIEEKNNIRFAHDKIQQACYQMNEESELPGIHYNIACILIKNDLYKSTNDLFNLVSHLNKGFEYVLREPEKYFQIYFAAAQQSKEITAYHEFLDYIEKSKSLLSSNTSEQIRYKCLSEYHVALHLNGKYQEADEFFEKELLNYDDLFALKDNYVTKVSQGSMLGKYELATSFGLSILKKLGIEINMSPDIKELKEELNQIRQQFKEQGINTISDLKYIPQKNPREMEFICELISSILPGSFFFSPLVSSLLIFETIRLALKNGVYSSMGYPFSIASAPYILIENNYITGYDYSEFAIKISGNNKRSSGNAKHLFILFCWHWLKPLQDNKSLEIAREAFYLLRQGGDIQMSGFIFVNTILCLFERGDELKEVLVDIRKGLDYSRKTANFHAFGPYSVFEQFVLSMMSENASTNTFEINGFNETQYLKDNESNTMGRCFLYIYKTQYLYLHKHYKLAYEYSVKSKELITSIAGFISTSNHFFYAALCYCRFYTNNKEIENELTIYTEQLRIWSDQIPENWLQKYYLVMAERLRYSEDKSEAISYYVRAIQTARTNQFTHDLALSQELLAEFWFEQKNYELANVLLEMAYKTYRQWGANSKINAIETSHPQIKRKLQSANIDLLNIIKAQNILAQETQIDVLLKKMLHILIEVSAAKKCYLILKDDGWKIEAFLDTQGGESILKGIELNPNILSIDLINYVIRTKTGITSDKLKSEIRDPYILQKKPKSTLVLPILNQSEIVAVIYLEHSELENIFTEERQETITLLSSQMAISLVNARLYRTLEEKVKQRTEELEAANEELHASNDELYNTNIQLDKESNAKEKAVASLKESEKELRQSNVAKDKFFSIIAHDLKGPVGSISNILKAVKNDEIDLDEEIISAISESAQNTYNLLDDLLVWARSQKKALVSNPKSMNVNELIDSAVAVYRFAAEGKNITLETVRLEEDVFIYADWQMTNTILRNLINNAIKFTKNGGKVQVTTKRVNQKILITISDSGIGMDKETLEMLFKIDIKSISRTGTNNETGTGLGLVVCKELIELNHGEIGVESTVNTGSKFWIKLPYIKKQKVKQIFNWVDFLSRQKTLYIEDNPIHIKSCNLLLSQYGLVWDIVTSGKEGLQKALAGNYNLIFMDINLPDISGVEITKAIRKQNSNGVKIVALSSFNQHEIKNIEREELFDGYLQKPLDTKELENLLRSLIIPEE
ncbi:AAA family ATPase [Labilibaculum sp. K2S]|uniref:AAA family ATPase n=1 Tax=Labilibaculum sp. K2S TaxID=3056386 RepID=UPI0025A31596|nr:AAA family ATPase [Labilibaculum sp. K2S]MDM8158583.1 AAA family ATPase [Labilibaculum sp. K2S]